jgi:hypothetical protein
MKKAVIFFGLIFSILACNTIEPPPPPPPNGVTIENTITLSTLWQDLNKIAINFTRSQLDTHTTFSYKLKRKNPTGSETEYLFMLTGLDTTFIDENLNQGAIYRYKVEAEEQQGKTADTSKTLIVTTLDTTSHEITWTIDTLGQPGDLGLFDVWGIDENNVWAVGAVNMQQGVTSVIKWDGIKWNFHSWPEGGARGIWGFSENDIWTVGDFSNRGFVGHYNGANWTEYRSEYFLAKGDTVYPLYAVWGAAPDDVWAVGDKGTIIHWDGVEWKKADGINEKYTLWDIWGFDEFNVYTIGNERNEKMILYKYDGNEWKAILNRPTSSSIRSTVWGPYRDMLYALDLEKYKIINESITTFTIPVQESAIYKIRGDGANNLFTVGAFGEVIHFNGVNWDKQDELYIYPNSRLLRGVWVKGNKVFVVGQIANNGAIIIQGTIN